MGTKAGCRISMAALVVATGASLVGCAEQQHARTGVWGEQWYQKGKTPDDIAKWERAHPVRPSRPDDSADQGGGEAPN